jgi:four helix bundle protein
MTVTMPAVSEQIRSHRDLEVWKKAMNLVDAIYRFADTLPRREQFGLWSQLTRAAVSAPTNIAEGRARSSAKDFANFLTIARSSLMELDTLVRVCRRRSYCDDEALTRLTRQIEEVSKMITGLKRGIALRHLTPHTSHLTPQMESH